MKKVSSTLKMFPSSSFPLITLIILIADSANGACYFPMEFSGDFLTQSLSSREIAYNSITVLLGSIPSWGECHQRLGRHYILKKSAANSNTDCFKCISIVPRSLNVLQIHTSSSVVGQSSLDSECHASEELARISCPTRSEIMERRVNEFMLYKIRDYYGGAAVTKTYCPLNGRFAFTYSINDGTEDDLECTDLGSESTDCPSGYGMILKFRGCSFEDFDMNFQCLATWPSERPGETYLSLLDTKLPQIGEEPRPRYRCAIFKEDPETGVTHLALSSDSTCTNHLYSATDGYETLHMNKIRQMASTYSEEEENALQLPINNYVDPRARRNQKLAAIMAAAQASSISRTPRHQISTDGINGLSSSTEQKAVQCTFPDWMQGKFEGLDISGSKLVYRDETNFVTYRGHCLQEVESDMDDVDTNMLGFDRSQFEKSSGVQFILHLETDCGRASRYCARFENRHTNIMEFQFGPMSSGDSCSASYITLTQNNWITLGRTDTNFLPGCPLVGEFTAVLPDATNICTKSYTDCNNPQLMFYTVFNCSNVNHIYWEREYRCFGQWVDPIDGLVYTYTQRLDIPGNECFVGVTISDDEHIVTEGGTNCERGHRPREYGMVLRRQSGCASTSSSTNRDSTRRIPSKPYSLDFINSNEFPSKTEISERRRVSLNEQRDDGLNWSLQSMEEFHSGGHSGADRASVSTYLGLTIVMLFVLLRISLRC